MFKFALIALFAAAAMAAPLDDNDEKYGDDNDRFKWIQAGRDFAEQDLQSWYSLVERLGDKSPSSMSSEFLAHFTPLQATVQEIATNNKQTSMGLLQVVTGLNAIVSTPSLGAPDVAKFTALLAAVTGKRDHKSYYLGGGVMEYLGRRVENLNSAQSSSLKASLVQLQTAVTKATTVLDAGAQEFVKAIAAVNMLAKDVERNQPHLKAVLGQLATAFKASPLLKLSDAMVASANKVLEQFNEKPTPKPLSYNDIYNNNHNNDYNNDYNNNNDYSDNNDYNNDRKPFPIIHGIFDHIRNNGGIFGHRG